MAKQAIAIVALVVVLVVVATALIIYGLAKSYYDE